MAMLTSESRIEYLIMCPSAFDLDPGGRPKRTVAIGDTKPNNKQNLNEVEPRSVTFLHEVIHVVRGNAITNAVDNPEKCMYFGKVAEAST